MLYARNDNGNPVDFRNGSNGGYIDPDGTRYPENIFTLWTPQDLLDKLGFYPVTLSAVVPGDYQTVTISYVFNVDHFEQIKTIVDLPKPTDDERIDAAFPQTDVAHVIFEAFFEHENRIRVLEGRAAITRAQARDWFKSKLEAL